MLKCLLFDLDGTLVDSLALTFDSFNYVFEKFGARRHTPAEIMAHFGPGEVEIFARVVGNEHREAARDAYFEYTRPRAHLAPLHVGIEGILEECANREIAVGIVTGRGRESTLQILEHLGISTRFGTIITHDDVSSSKPSPEGILKALGILGFKPDEAAYVGDMWMDVRAAQRAGVLSVSVGWDASHDRALVDAEKPHAWMANASEFWPQIDSLSQAAVPVN